MFSAVKQKARAAARAAALNLMAVILLTVGLAFLTASAWVALAAAFPLEIVALIVGGAYTGMALILFAAAAMLSGSGSVHHAESAAKPAPPAETDLAKAFLTGFSAGQGAARGRHS